MNSATCEGIIPQKEYEDESEAIIQQALDTLERDQTHIGGEYTLGRMSVETYTTLTKYFQKYQYLLIGAMCQG